MKQVQHVPFNPQSTWSIEPICNDWQRGGWSLQRVVYWSSYEAIAVFERDQDAVGETP